MGTSSLPPSYLPHLNGLRALAILGVLAYHLRESYCPAGYFGVDLFLVISGFLLFRSLFKPGAAQEFHYGSYLLKKAWRILPSWFLVALACCAVSVYLFPNHGSIGPVLKTARTGALFHADFYIDEIGDYFNTATQQNPLLHFWYLSIIQQLYIIAPLLVIPLARWSSRRAAAILLAVLALLSLAYHVLANSPTLLSDGGRINLLAATGSVTAYYHLLPRFWEVLAGAAVLLLPEFGSSPRLRGMLGLLGLAALPVSFYLYKTGSPNAYLTVVASMLALRYASTGPAAWILGLKPIQALGTISFSLYLWHWPIMAFWKYCCMDAPGPWDEAGMLAASLLLGTLSWWWIERLRIPSGQGWRGTLLRCSVVLLLPLALVASTKVNKYVRRHMPVPDTTSIEEDAQFRKLPPEKLRGLERLPELGMPKPLLRFGDAGKEPTFLLIGDSHAQHLQHELHDACVAQGESGVFFGNSTQPYWFVTRPVKMPDTCCWSEGIANSLLAWLKATPSIRYVLIAQLWPTRLRYSEISDWRTGRKVHKVSERLKLSSEGLRETCRQLKAIGVEVVLLGDTPNFAMHNATAPAPVDVWMRCKKFGMEYKEHVISAEEHEKDQACARALHQSLVEEGLAHYIDLAPAVMADGAYPARIGENFLYTDTNHLSSTGATRVATYLLPRLRALMQQEQQAGESSAQQGIAK